MRSGPPRPGPMSSRCDRTASLTSRHLEQQLSDGVASLVCLMLANNETGVYPAGAGRPPRSAGGMARCCMWMRFRQQGGCRFASMP